MVASTTLFLTAARFGLAPSTKLEATAGARLIPRVVPTGQISADPEGEEAAACMSSWLRV